jgi:hypothetical protein
MVGACESVTPWKYGAANTGAPADAGVDPVSKSKAPVSKSFPLLGTAAAALLPWCSAATDWNIAARPRSAGVAFLGGARISSGRS